MPVDTTEQTRENIESQKKNLGDKDTETSLVTFGTDLEAGALKDNINNPDTTTSNQDAPANNPNIPTSNQDAPASNPNTPTSNPNTPTSNPNVPINNPENQRENLALKQQLETLNKIKILLEGYKSLRKGIKTSEGNIQTKKQLTHWLDENIENLNNMRKDLGGNNESLKYPDQKVTELKENTHIYTDLTTYKARIYQLQDRFDNYEQVRQIIVLGGRTSDFPAIIDSIQDAKKSKHYEKQDNKYQKKMNKILHDPAITSLRNKDLERYEEYLEAVINGEVEPSNHPFYKDHCKSFMMIQSVNPSLYQILAPSKGRKQYNTPTAVPVSGVIIEGSPAVTTTRAGCNQPESFHSRLGKGFGEALGKIFPSIENNPRQKKAWEQFGAVAALGGSIFMGFKALKSLFSKKSENPDKRRDTALWSAGLIALMNGDKIVKGGTNRFQNAFNLHPAEKIQTTTEIFQAYGFSNPEAQKMAVMHVEAPIATLSALHFIPIYELNNQHIVEYQNNQFKFNYDNYKNYVDTYDSWTAEQKKVVLDAGENLKKNDSLDDGLNALGVHSQGDLDRIANGDQNKTLANEPSVYQRYYECTKGVTSGVNAELYTRGLKAKDVESAKKIIKEYEQNPGKDIDELINKRKNEGLLEVATETPMVRILTDLGITFEDPTEITKTEERLNNIKEGMRYQAPGIEGYKPYSIEGNKLMFTTADTDTESKKKIHIPDDRPDRFPDQHRTLDDFPTISNNREKFLEFLNNPQNHMRGKEISSRDN